jgi:hypothetical protein
MFGTRTGDGEIVWPYARSNEVPALGQELTGQVVELPPIR